ncbi:sugar kinase [Candidatus Poribacteria bacterium]|mgnify:CR=1 FL=1|nr:MAG: sugar kinase [Candidatus Poribacteria bacterium]
MSDLVVVGSVALDSVETPYGKVERALGGSATYFSVAASFLPNVKVKLVAVVGEDFPREHVEMLKSRGIDLEGLKVEKGKTFHWRGRYTDPNTVETLATELNVYAGFKPELPESYRSTDYLFLGNINPDLQLEVLNQVESPKLVACDTIKLWIDTMFDQLLEVLKRVDVVIINDSEAKMIAREGNLIKAAEKLLDLGPKRVVIKKGEHGAISLTSDSFFAIPAYPVRDVVDPTGAGDTFAGGLMGYLASVDRADEEVFRMGMAYGTALASFDVEDFSLNRLLSIGEGDLRRRLEELREMTRF